MVIGNKGGYNHNTVPRGLIEVVAFDPGQQELAAPECGADKRRLWSACLRARKRTRSLTLYFADLLIDLRLRRRALTSVVVALGVLTLHGLVLAPLFAGSAFASSHLQFGSPTIIQASLLDDRSTSVISPPVLSRSQLQPIPVDLPDDIGPHATDPSLAALYGRYLGQIHARIDRAWVRPRSAIGAPLFRCQVEVDQGPDGTVGTVTLQRCNGTMRWQQSLVQGITAASPLPAPPNPAVFAEHVILHFEAVAFAPGEPADEYAAPQTSALRITGSHIEVQSQVR